MADYFGVWGTGISKQADDITQKLRGMGNIGNGVHADTIRDATRWFSREVGIVQSKTTGRLRAVLGTRTRTPRYLLNPDEVFIVHTHPVFETRLSHFRLDLMNKNSSRIEAVVDMDGNLSYFKNSFLDLNVQDLRSEEPINSAGYIVGYTK